MIYEKEGTLDFFAWGVANAIVGLSATEER